MPPSTGSGSGFGKKKDFLGISKYKHKDKEEKVALLLQSGKFSAAEQILRSLIAEQTKNHDTYFQLAMLCGTSGRFHEMQEMLEIAIEIKPDFSNALFNLGVLSQNSAKFEKAIEYYKLVLKSEPAYLPAIANLGVLLQKKRQTEQAIDLFRAGLELDPDHLECLYNLGTAYQELDRYEEAISLYKAALVKSPGNPDICNNLGRIYRNLRQIYDSKSYFELAISSSSEHNDANWEYSLLLLLLGDYAIGLNKYEYRWKATTPTRLVASPPPLALTWNGSNHHDGQEILLLSEQGLGDTIQLLRYVKYLETSGFSVSICAPTKLHGLIINSRLCETVYSPEDIQYKTDCLWLPLMSLLRVLMVNPSNVIVSDPYITCNKLLFQEWRSKIDCNGVCVIGLNWQGNPDTEKNSILKGRSFPLEKFLPLSQVPNVRFVSLQKGSGSEQLATCSFRNKFVSCQEEVHDTWDFLDNAAIIMNCSLVITSDTMVAHLAAALGRPTWLMLHANSDWRWGLEGDTTFWYPSMRLFRQQEWGNWDEVMIRVALELDKFLSDKKHLVFQDP